METKSEIRKRILKIRNEMPKEERRFKSDVIAHKLLSMDIYKEANNILCYVDYQSEVHTDKLIEASWRDGKNVYVPLVCGEDMHFYKIDSFNQLACGYKGIMEPVPHVERQYRIHNTATEMEGMIKTEGLNKKDLIIVPGAVFDKSRNRIGYGKGFYDRFLSSGFEGKSVALAYELQVVSDGTFLAEVTDIKPDFIITEQ